MLDLDETINPNGSLEYMLQISREEKALFSDEVSEEAVEASFWHPGIGPDLMVAYRANNIQKVISEL